MTLTKEEVLAKMGEKDVVLLNVLPQPEFQKLHIKGSENFPLTLDYGGFIQDIEKKHGKQTRFITYGDRLSRVDGASAAQAMRVLGFSVDHYPGGIQEWYEAGLPTEGTLAGRPVHR